MRLKAGLLAVGLLSWTLALLVWKTKETNHAGNISLLSYGDKVRLLQARMQSLQENDGIFDVSDVGQGNRPPYVPGGDPLTGGTSW
jgi:hypothetical protein